MRTEVLRRTVIIHHKLFNIHETKYGVWFADFKGPSGNQYYVQGASYQDLLNQIEVSYKAHLLRRRLAAREV